MPLEALKVTKSRGEVRYARFIILSLLEVELELISKLTINKEHM